MECPAIAAHPLFSARKEGVFLRRNADQNAPPQPFLFGAIVARDIAIFAILQ
jgi:hypothetical protein